MITKIYHKRSFTRNGLVTILNVIFETKMILLLLILLLLTITRLRSIISSINLADVFFISRWENQERRFKKNTENGKKPKRVKNTCLKKGPDRKRTTSKWKI